MMYFFVEDGRKRQKRVEGLILVIDQLNAQILVL